MKNIAIINVGNDGSTGKIAINLLGYFSQNKYNTTFYYGRGCKENSSNQVRFESLVEVLFHALAARITGLQGCFSFWATYRLLRLLKKKETDTVIMVNPQTYYLNERLLYSFIAKRNLRFIYIMPDSYAYLGKCCIHHECDKYITGKGKCPNKRCYPESWFFDTCSIILKNKEKCYAQMNRALFLGPEFVINNVKKSYLGRVMRTAILDEAIDLDLYKPRDTSLLRNKLGIADDKIIILCVAPQYKNVDLFQQVADRMIGDGRYVFVHVGSGEFVSHDNYIHVGFVEKDSDLAIYYSMADLFLFPSTSDTMSNACLEALACGTPLLVFNISGMPYLLDDTVGTLVKPRNVEELVAVVLKTTKKTPSLIQICRDYAIKRYDMKQYAKKVEIFAKEL